eukprot:CAMPEP_0118953346 /NCGR_PEP_ID=MMETSP1169-20130426/56408_1 /TAXON_ID=36882 /ORGANISM="Pyramimonas obovata, Strain CCMP722" /LENGTH=31 /DNA_ID= /DNA_START= /DNA_END= /DNA_ORIENTATION=
MPRELEGVILDLGVSLLDVGVNILQQQLSTG